MINSAKPINGLVKRDGFHFVQPILQTTQMILPDGQFAHGRHAKIARRVNLSRAARLAEDPKSASHSQTSRLDKRGASRSSRTLGAGCGGRGGDARRAALIADGETVWS